MNHMIGNRPADVHQYATSQRPFSLLIMEGPITTPKSATCPRGICAPLLAVTSRLLPSSSGVLAEIRGITHPHGQTLTVVNGDRKVVAANRSLNQFLHVVNVNGGPRLGDLFLSQGTAHP